MNSKVFPAFSLNPGQGWLLAALLATAAASLWLLRALEQGETPAPPVLERQWPDYTVSDYAATTMDAVGLIRYQLQALETRHYPEAETELTEPYLVFYTDARPVWYARAEAGRISADQKTVWLLGETRLWRYNLLGQWQATILTRDLMLRPDEQYAETAAHALLTAPNGTLESMGLQAYLQERRVELLGQVKGHYEQAP